MQTKLLSEFVHDLSGQALSEAALDMGKKCVEDLVGVALAGSVQPQGAIWRTYFLQGPQAPEAAVWGRDFLRISCAQAAGLNAAWGHLLDMDDVHNASVAHLSVVTVPVAMALGQRLRRSGREVLAAIAAGYEVGARVGEALMPGCYYYWHTTGVVGALSSAAAAGKLLRLTPEQLCNALGNAGTQAAGLWEFLSDGAMSKALHTANATLCGLRAAELAQLGLTGASRILEGERGLLAALTPDARPEALTKGLSAANLKILQNSFKRYACCRHTHAANYAAASLLAEGRVAVDEIASIVDHTYAVAMQTTDNPSPATPYAFKFSGQYCIAAILLHGDLLEERFSEEAVRAPAARALVEKITMRLDEALEREHQRDPNRWPHRLEITLTDGRVLEKRVDYPPGDFNSTFGWDELDEKFFSLTAPALSEDRARDVCRRVRTLDSMRDVNELFA